MEIDVSKCQEYGYELDGKHKCFCRPDLMNGEVMGYDNCEDIPLEQCYYKQREQFKIENEKLKAKIQEYVEDRFCQGGCAIYQFDKIEELKQKNQELDKCIEDIKEIIMEFSKKDILTLPDLKPKDNYTFIQKQCAKPIFDIIKRIREIKS